MIKALNGNSPCPWRLQLSLEDAVQAAMEEDVERIIDATQCDQMTETGQTPRREEHGHHGRGAAVWAEFHRAADQNPFSLMYQ